MIEDILQCVYKYISPVGIILPFAGDSEPDGWYLCQGQELLIADHERLFEVLGVTYGGDGVTTFALPDLRNRLLIGAGDLQLGENGGSNEVSLTTAQLPVHNHALRVSTASGTEASLAGNVLAVEAAGATAVYASVTPDDEASDESISEVGAGQPVSILPPVLALNFIIRAS